MLLIWCKIGDKRHDNENGFAVRKSHVVATKSAKAHESSQRLHAKIAMLYEKR